MQCGALPKRCRTAMQWDLGTTSYAYSDSLGGLLTLVTGPDAMRYRIFYDALDRLDSLAAVPTSSNPGWGEKRKYDSDSRLIYRSEGTYALGTIILDSLQYEPRDLLSRIVTTSGVVGTHQVLTTHYDGVGAVLAQEAVRAAGSLWSVQEFRPDAFGNVVYSRNRGSSAVDDAPRISSFSVAGALMERTAVLPATPNANNQDDDYTQTVLHGRVDRESELTSRANVNGGGWVRQVATRHYYDGLNRLAVEQRYDQSFDPNDDSPVAASGTWEEHAYDALGRRVRVRSRDLPPVARPPVVTVRG